MLNPNHNIVPLKWVGFNFPKYYPLIMFRDKLTQTPHK